MLRDALDFSLREKEEIARSEKNAEDHGTRESPGSELKIGLT